MGNAHMTIPFQVYEPTRATWSCGGTSSGRTQSRRSPRRRSCSWCGRPCRTSHLSSSKSLPSCPWASACTNPRSRIMQEVKSIFASVLSYGDTNVNYTAFRVTCRISRRRGRGTWLDRGSRHSHCRHNRSLRYGLQRLVQRAAIPRPSGTFRRGLKGCVNISEFVLER